MKRYFFLAPIFKILKKAYRESEESEEFEFELSEDLEDVVRSISLELNRQRIYGEESKIPVIIPEDISRSEVEKALKEAGFSPEEISRIEWINETDFEESDEGRSVIEDSEKLIESVVKEVEELGEKAIDDVRDSIKHTEKGLVITDKTKFRRGIANYLVRPLLPHLYISFVHILMNYIDRLYGRKERPESVYVGVPEKLPKNVNPVDAFLKGLLWDCIIDSSIVALSDKELLIEALVTGNYVPVSSIFRRELESRSSTVLKIVLDREPDGEFINCCTKVFEDHLVTALDPKDLVDKISQIYLENIFNSISAVVSLYDDSTIELKNIVSPRKESVISDYTDKMKEILLSDDFEKEFLNTFKDLPSIVGNNFPGRDLVEKVAEFAISKLGDIMAWIFTEIRKSLNLLPREDILPKGELIDRIIKKIRESLTNPRELYIVREKVEIDELRFSKEVASGCKKCIDYFVSSISETFKESEKEPFVIKKVKETEKVPFFEISEVARIKEMLNFLFAKARDLLVPLEIARLQNLYSTIRELFERIGAGDALPKDISELVSGPLETFARGISNKLYNIIEKCNSINTIYAFLYYTINAYIDIFTELKSTLSLEETIERLSRLIGHHIREVTLSEIDQSMKGTLKEGSLIKIGNDLFNVLKVEGNTMYLASHDMLESEGYSELYECPTTLDYEVTGSFNYTVKRCPIDGIVVKKDAFCTNCPFGLSYDSCYTCVAKSLEKEATKNARYPKVVTSQSSLLDDLLENVTFKTVKKPIATKSSSVIVYDIVRHKTGHLGIVTDTNYDGSLKVYWPETESSTIVWRQEIEKVDESSLK